MSSNLPPGVTDSMIPGNRPEDAEWDNAVDALLDELCKAGIQAHELPLVAKAGIHAVQQLHSIEKCVKESLQHRLELKDSDEE